MFDIKLGFRIVAVILVLCLGGYVLGVVVAIIDILFDLTLGEAMFESPIGRAVTTAIAVSIAIAMLNKAYAGASGGWLSSNKSDLESGSGGDSNDRD